MRIRDKMPNLEGATEWLNGEVISDELIGATPTLIHFWSVSCGLCKEAMPKINELREQFHDKLTVVAVHLPRSEQDLDIDQVKEVAAKHHITQPIFIDNLHQLTDAFENDYVPAYYVFDKEGLLRHYQAGEGSFRLLEKRIQRLIGV